MLASAIAVAVVFGGVSLAWGLVGLAAGVAWVLWVGRTAADATAMARARENASSAQGPGEAPALWRQVLDGVVEPAVVLDREQRVVAANRAADALFPGLEGRLLIQIVRHPELLGAVGRVLESKGPQAFEIEPATSVGRHLAGTAMPLRSDAAEPSAPALLIVLHDRTEAEQLAQMRADFVANASHELRTPLASLKGFVETLRGAAKDDPVAREQFLGIMQEQATRMSRLIEDLLSLSRIEMHEHVPPDGIVDLSDVVIETVDSLRHDADKAGVSIDASALMRPARVKGDRGELVQVVQNLVQNAIKYGRKGGTVRISLARDGERFELAVADDGIGIAPEHVPRLTERFYRVNAKDSRERGGTGLGLAIVKHIVSRHRGQLKVASKLGEGSTFTILLSAPRET